MDIISVQYRFLRLSSERLALVEIYPFSNIPEPSTCLYPFYPYLTDERLVCANLLELRDWITDWGYAFDLAVEEAENSPIIDYQNKIGEDREVLLWNYLDPLEEIQWDKYCPLFDNDFNLILREV